MLTSRVRKMKLFLLALAIAALPGTAATAAPKPLPQLDTYLAQLPLGWRQRAGDIIRQCETQSAYRIPVLIVSYFPTVGPPDAERLDPGITGVDLSLADVRARVAQINHHLRWALELGSTYHGLRDPSAQCSLEYDIVKTVEYLEALPVSDFPGFSLGVLRPGYRQILEREDVCRFVSERGVKEVWLWGYEHGNIGPTESNMAGPNGDVSNSERVADLPVCGRTYTLYNYNYSRLLGEAIHVHGHQFEAVLGHVDRHGLFADFVSLVGRASPAVNSCGNVHLPPNGRFDYDWQNPAVVETDCRHWNPQGTGKRTSVSCQTWECREDGAATYLVWWMMNFPGRDNPLRLNGRRLRNWWAPIADFDAAVASGKGLLR
jgi:hypothetical protein